MSKRSAGIVLYRHGAKGLEVLLVHPGGPYWSRKDEGAWSVPKGEHGDDEDAFDAACREFEEEVGIRPSGEFIPLTAVRQKSGKLVTAWAVEGDADPAQLSSNLFSMEWPPRSGQMQDFPEVDRAEWFTLQEARTKINGAQVALLEELKSAVDPDLPG